MKLAILKTTREQFAGIFVAAVILMFFVLGMYPGTRLDQYRPRSEDEARIIRVLMMFEKAKTEYHLENYLSCLGGRGEFMFGGAIMVSKEELKKLLPPFWADLKSNPLKTVPSSREELNGNYFSGTFYDPVIDVSKDTAKAIITFVTPVSRWKTKLFLDFQKYNSSWKINRFEWDMG